MSGADAAREGPFVSEAERLTLRIAATHTSLEMMVRQIDSTRRGCGVWPQIRRLLGELDDLREALHHARLVETEMAMRFPEWKPENT